MTDKSRIIIAAVSCAIIAAAVVISYCAGYRYGRRTAADISHGQNTEVQVDSTVRIDTTSYDKPAASSEVVVKKVLIPYPVTDSTAIYQRDSLFAANGLLIQQIDSLNACLVRQQREYGGDGYDYHAVVSGYDPKLDRIEVFPKTVTVTKTEIRFKEASKWSFGVGIGPGVLLDFKGQPHVGIAATVGVNYRFERTH